MLVAAMLAGCGTRPLAEVLPQKVGDWTLAKSAPIPAGEVLPEVRERSPEGALRAEYRGPAPVTLMLFQMQSEASAFALMQSWRRREGAQPFYRGPLFGIAEGAERKVLISFVREFERSLPR